VTLVQVRNLSMGFDRADGRFTEAVKDVSFDLGQGEFVGLVGESGSGKSTLGFGLTRLLKAPGRITSGSIVFDEVDIARLGAEEVRRQRNGGFAMVLQSGMNALNPVRRLQDHFVDIFRAHHNVAARDAKRRATELVEKVELPTTALSRYPGELSGGMRQRAAIALALALDPRFVVFDEPTTALDVLVQASVMRTISELQRAEGFTAVLISHDLGLVLEHADRVLVMHAGEIVEDAGPEQILAGARDDYTKLLLSHYADPRAEHVSLPGIGEHAVPDEARPRASRSRAGHRPAHDAAIVVDGATKIYRPSRWREKPVVAVEDVSFTVAPGAAVALVGASGSGKSTLTRLITGIERPTSGTVTFGTTRVDQLGGRGVRRLHEDIQLVFQDPYSALNPLHRIGYILGRGFANFEGVRGPAVRDRVIETLEAVDLTPGDDFVDRLPHELSGGQRQRVVIARALACNPRVLVADEPVSMLDVTLRAGILALLDELRRERGVSLLYITHDLLSARVLTDEIIVLENGRVVESGVTAEVLQHPRHDYSKALIAAAPNPWSRLAT